MRGKLPGDDGKRYAHECSSFVEAGPGILKTTDIQSADRTRARLTIVHNRFKSFAVTWGVRTGAFAASDFQLKIIQRVADPAQKDIECFRKFANRQNSTIEQKIEFMSVFMSLDMKLKAHQKCSN